VTWRGCSFLTRVGSGDRTGSVADSVIQNKKDNYTKTNVSVMKFRVNLQYRLAVLAVACNLSIACDYCICMLFCFHEETNANILSDGR